MMKLKTIVILFGLIIFLGGCNKDWDKHFETYPETVDQNVWDALNNDPSISHFVQLLKDNKFDTLFNSDRSLSVFAPRNEAFQMVTNEDEIDTTLLKYHLSEYVIQSGNINGKRKIKTFSKKFALFERNGNAMKLDDQVISSESPLYRNGKYFVLDEIAFPKPNFYEFYTKNNPIFKAYIDSQDSIALDPELSKPIGFDEDGNTVFDTVSVRYNKFEMRYFPVSEEFRSRSATIVYPLQEDYENALTEMAQNLGAAGYEDYTDIPEIWQQEELIPYLLKRGIFENKLEPIDFVWRAGNDTLKLKNIQGDSVKILYSPTDRTICSNGYAYNYMDFKVPDSLYREASRLEGESLLKKKTGSDKYSWRETVSVSSDEVFVPYREYIGTASNDSILRVLFSYNYTGNYSVEFETQNLFPRRYLMIVRTHMDYGGVYNIYVNDQLVRTFDYYDYARYKGILPSVHDGYYILQGRYNKFDMYVDNITEFGKAKIRFEYVEPGNVSSNGLVLDYIDFLPLDQ